MITDRIGLHSVLLPLLIIQVINKIGQQHSGSLICLITSMITDWIGQYNNKICDFSSLRKRPTFLDATTGFPAKLHLGNERRNSILMMRYWPDLGSASDGLKNLFQPEALPRSGYWWVISMEFLCLFLRRHFVGKPVVASWNVGCSLWQWCFKLFSN